MARITEAKLHFMVTLSRGKKYAYSDSVHMWLRQCEIAGEDLYPVDSRTVKSLIKMGMIFYDLDKDLKLTTAGEEALKKLGWIA